MTRPEAARVVLKISTMYANEYSKIPADNLEMIVQMWADTCEGYTGEQIEAALQQYMANDTSGFAPKPGQLIQYLVAPEDSNDLTASEAWAMVVKAMSNAIYGAEEEWEKLPPMVQRAVGTSYVLREMAMMPVESMGVEESHFRRAYLSQLESERVRRRSPASAMKLIEGGRMALEG